jgi:short-subunit dehydrogenase
VTAVIVGASSGLGRALSSEMASRRMDLLLVASDVRDLDAIAADLALRHGVQVRSLAMDVGHEPDPAARIVAALEGMPSVTALLLPLGASREDDDLTLDVRGIGQLLAINLHAPLAIVHGLLPALLQSRGVIVLFGSIASIRGRGRNVVYAAAKRGLISLYESLRQRHRPDELRVQFYQLGFLATNLTYGMHLPMRAIEPAAVARSVGRRLGGASAFRHVPERWRLLAIVLRAMPWALYRRIRS